MVNVAYATTVCGIFKIVVVISSLIATICSGVYGSTGAAGYLIFVGVCSCIIEAALFVIYIFQLNESSQAPWFYIDFGILCVLGLLNFIAFCVSAAFGWIPAIGAAAFFFAVVLVALAIDAVFLFRAGKGTASLPKFGGARPKGPSYVGEEQPVSPTDTVPDYNTAEQPKPSKMEP